MSDQQYWIDDCPNLNPFLRGEGVGVIDEAKAGIIAYFGSEDDAKLFVQAKLDQQRKKKES